MNEIVQYRFEVYLYPAKVSRVEIESGEGDWVFIRRRHHQLAKERGEAIALYVHNHCIQRWNYLGKTLPNGEHYIWNDSGPYELLPDCSGYRRKKKD